MNEYLYTFIDDKPTTMPLEVRSRHPILPDISDDIPDTVSNNLSDENFNRLYYATSVGNLDIFKYLHEKNDAFPVNINMMDYAIECRSLSITRYLHEHGFNCTKKGLDTLLKCLHNELENIYEEPEVHSLVEYVLDLGKKCSPSVVKYLVVPGYLDLFVRAVSPAVNLHICMLCAIKYDLPEFVKYIRDELGFREGNAETFNPYEYMKVAIKKGYLHWVKCIHEEWHYDYSQTDIPKCVMKYMEPCTFEMIQYVWEHYPGKVDFKSIEKIVYEEWWVISDKEILRYLLEYYPEERSNIFRKRLGEGSYSTCYLDIIKEYGEPFLSECGNRLFMRAAESPYRIETIKYLYEKGYSVPISEFMYSHEKSFYDCFYPIGPDALEYYIESGYKFQKTDVIENGENFAKESTHAQIDLFLRKKIKFGKYFSKYLYGRAIEENDLGMLQSYYNRGVKVHMFNQEWLMIKAVEAGNLDIIQYLCKDLGFKCGKTIINSSPNVTVLRWLWENTPDRYTKKVIEEAVERKDLEMVQFLFEHGINKGAYVKKAFEQAINNNSVDIIDFFQDKKVKIDYVPMSHAIDINLFKRYYKNSKKKNLSDLIRSAEHYKRSDIMRFLFDMSDTEREMFKNCAVCMNDFELVKYIYENSV